MKKQQAMFIALIGVVLLATGLLLKMPGQTAFASLPLPYICIGVGCSAFGHGTGELVRHRVQK